MNTISIAACRMLPIGADAPAESVKHVWLAKNGARVLLRPIAPDDFEIERDFVSGLSLSSRYMRLMSARRPTADELYRWTHIDRRREGAVIATIEVDGRERQIGVARYAMEKDAHDGEAEIAIVVADAWQGCGLGRELVSSLIELARRSGVQRLYGTTLAENDAMIGLARCFGFTVARDAGVAFVMTVSLVLASYG